MFFKRKNKQENEPKSPSLFVVPDESVINGDIQSTHNIRLDGDVVGKIVTNSRIVISAGARVKGNIKCKEILIYGFVEGNILATEYIELKGEAHIKGNLVSQKIQTDLGVTIDGKTKIVKDNLDQLHGASV